MDDSSAHEQNIFICQFSRNGKRWQYVGFIRFIDLLELLNVIYLIIRKKNFETFHISENLYMKINSKKCFVYFCIRCFSELIFIKLYLFLLAYFIISKIIKVKKDMWKEKSENFSKICRVFGTGRYGSRDLYVI